MRPPGTGDWGGRRRKQRGREGGREDGSREREERRGKRGAEGHDGIWQEVWGPCGVETPTAALKNFHFMELYGEGRRKGMRRCGGVWGWMEERVMLGLRCSIYCMFCRYYHNYNHV